MGSGGDKGSIFERIDKLVTDSGPKLTESLGLEAAMQTILSSAGVVVGSGS